MSVWTSRGGIASANGGAGIASYGGVTLLVDLSGNVFKSTDGGVTWALLTTIPDVGSNSTLTVSNGTWVWFAGDASCVLYRSTNNGASWTAIPVASVYGGNGGVTQSDGAGHWTVIANEIGLGSNAAYSSDDGITWTHTQTISDTTGFQGAWDGANFVYGGMGSGHIIETSDGITWTVTPSSAAFASIAFNPSGPIYVGAVVSTNAVRFSSTALGLTTAANTPIPGLDSGGLFPALFAAGIFVVFDSVGGVASSPDGSAWTIGTSNFPPTDGCLGVAYDSVNQNFIALSYGGYVSTLAVSSGAAVPNVVGDTFSDATLAITSDGFTVGQLTYAYSLIAPQGIVLSQNPVGGTIEALGSAVALQISSGPPIPGKLTKKLLLWLHRIFDKDPHQKLAFRLQYDGGMTWKINNGVLTTIVTGGTGANLNVVIVGYTIAQLADYLATQTGYSVPYQDSSRYADLSALALLDGTNNIAISNGDHIYGYTSLLWAYLEANGAELAIAEFQISKALQQMNTTTAQDEWLDYQGSFYNAPRKQGELDPNYSPRIIAGVLQPRGNNVAIASAIESIALGAQTVRVIDSIDNVGFSITYNGEIHFDGSSFYDAGLGPSGAYGFFDVDFSFDFGGSITQGTYFSQITSTVEEFRDGGTQLRTVIFRNNGSTATIISDTFVGNVRVIVYDDFTGLNFRVLESGLIRLTEAGDARLLES